MCTLCIQPKYSVRTGGFLPCHAKPDPIGNGGRLGCCHTPDSASPDMMLMHHISIRRHDPHNTSFSHFKSGRMRAIFFGFLCHQPDIGNGAATCWIKRTICFEKIDRFVINRRIGIIWDNAFTISFQTIWSPCPATSAD